MRVLFLHRNFPAQFRNLAIQIAGDPRNEVAYITGREDLEIKGIKKYVYKLSREVPKEAHNYLKFFEDSIIHGQAAVRVAMLLKQQGFEPDIIIGHSWGPPMFMKEVFPNVPLLVHFEWFYHAFGSDIDFIYKGKVPINTAANMRVKNSHLLLDLNSCDYGITPTQWQFEQLPTEYRHKISIIHEGIDTNYFAPASSDHSYKIPDKDIVLTKNDEVITYATRGMEPYRGFPEFMESVEIILKRRPNAHVIIVGDDRVSYGNKLPNGQTYKQLMLEKLDLDMSRVHFIPSSPYDEYRKILRVSSAHIYLTYPFVLSWSMLEAMSMKCVVIGSSTSPVMEVIEDGKNGLLVDFYSPEQIADRVDEVFAHPDRYEELRCNARQTIIDKFNMAKMLQKQYDLINKLVNEKSTV